ncbi:MAG: tetratricopeptide repeat protein [Microcoleaceae cyanobacterium]
MTSSEAIQAEIEQLNQQAERQIADQSWTAAIACLQQIIQLDPGWVYAYQKLGDLLLKTEQFDQAIHVCRKSIELDPGFFWSYIHLGAALSQLNAWEEATEIYYKALKVKPDFFWAYNNLAESLVQLERWQEADQVYQQASQLKSDFFWMYENWGQVLAQLHQWDQAAKIYQKAIELNPSSAQSYHNSGIILTRLQQWQEAVKRFQKAIEIQPNFPQAQQKLEAAQRVVQDLKQQEERSVSDQLHPVDWLKYYPIWGESPSYIFTKTAPVKFDDSGRTWDFPLPPKNLQFVFDENEDFYLESGKIQVSSLLELLQKQGISLKSGNRILDFGCAAGRMIRELVGFVETCEIWGVDISGDCIAWCKQNLSPTFHFFMGTTLPHLPFEDRYFDLIYAGSVFTHIDDLADAWFLELRRVLQPGGIAYVTIQEKHLIQKIQTNHGSHKDWLEKNNIWKRGQKSECIQKYIEYSQADFAMFTLGRDTRSLVFYDLDYFCQQRQPFFKVLEVRREAYYWQTAILLQRV